MEEENGQGRKKCKMLRKGKEERRRERRKNAKTKIEKNLASDGRKGSEGSCEDRKNETRKEG